MKRVTVSDIYENLSIIYLCLIYNVFFCRHLETKDVLLPQ